MASVKAHSPEYGGCNTHCCPQCPRNLMDKEQTLRTSEWGFESLRGCHTYFTLMSKNELLDLLTTVREHYRGRGTCKIFSLGDECKCPLCTIENTMALVETMKDDVNVELKVDIFVKPVIAADYIELKLV